MGTWKLKSWIANQMSSTIFHHGKYTSEGVNIPGALMKSYMEWLKLSVCWRCSLISTHVGSNNWRHAKHYSLRFKIKVTFGHELCYKIKVMFGEFFLKLRQVNWNVVRCCCWWWWWWTTKSNNNFHLFNNWNLDSMTSMHINVVLCASVPSAQIGKLPMKLVPKVLNFTMDTPSLPECT